MAFCSNCGNEMIEGSKFCDVCGQRVVTPGKKEQTVTVLRCPSCGASINSFKGKCESCGSEFFGLKISKSIKEFSDKLIASETTEQRINLIKSFPIPNTKEDIMEYMMLASSNIGYSEGMNDLEGQSDYENAWFTKFIQGYQKAKLVFEYDKDFAKIKTMYENTMARRENLENERRMDLLKSLLIKNLGVACGGVALLVALMMDVTKNNASFIELAGVIILIASASTLKKRDARKLDCLLAIGSGLCTVVLSFLFQNGSVLMLGGVITIIVSLISCLKSKY